MQEKLEKIMSFWLDLDQDLNFELGMNRVLHENHAFDNE